MKKQPKNEDVMSESRIQQDIVRHYRNTYCLKHHEPRSLIFSVPNESNGLRAMKLIQTGLYPGASDLVLCHRKNHLNINIINRWVMVEVKTESGKLSINQQKFREHCGQSGIRYEVVRSLDEFKQVIENL